MKKRRNKWYQPGKTFGGCVRMLPRVTLDNGKTYWVDERLKQLRNVKNPHDYIDF